MIVKHMTEILRQGRRYRRAVLMPQTLGCHPMCLAEIADNPGLSQDQLAQRMGFDKSNAARHVATLEGEGLISRRPSAKDKRVMELMPTEKADEVLPAIRKALSQWDEYLTADMTAEELALLERLLCRMKERAVNWRKEEEHV